jgi:hypothetical protein
MCLNPPFVRRLGELMSVVGCLQLKGIDIARPPSHAARPLKMQPIACLQPLSARRVLVLHRNLSIYDLQTGTVLACSRGPNCL